MDILSLLIFIPFLMGFVTLVLPISANVSRYIGLGVSIITLALAFEVYSSFEAIAGLQFAVIYPWISSYGIVYHIGIDGISLPILMAIVLLMPALYIILSHQRHKGYWANLMILQGGVTGALLSVDLVLFYLFWEMMLLPIFFMIGMYGSGDRRYIAMKVTLYTMFGSLLMLVSILYLGYNHYSQFGFWSFSLHDLENVKLTSNAMLLTFFGFIMAFAIKIPFFPFHTWMPATYSNAPTGTVVILSSIMAKLGVYALLRFVFPIFPELVDAYSDVFIMVALFGLVYFGIAALMQNDIKRMFAYSSGSHLSMIVVGIFSLNIVGLQGSIYLVFAHALATGALFMMVEHIEHHTKTKEINHLGGLAKIAPVYTILFGFFMFTVIGLPGTNGFVSELLIILGIFKVDITAGVITTTSALLGVSFMLWMFGRVLLGKAKEKDFTMPDLALKDTLVLVPIAIIILIMGIYPMPFLELIEPSLNGQLAFIKGVQ
jgi:NADH-quinone oxidoreductase subunit M